MVTESPTRPFDRIALDITEMRLSSDGNKYALVVMDYFSKYVRIYPMKNQRAETVTACLMDWVYELGVPVRLHSDQGPQFESAVFQEMCKRLGIHKTRTTPYHPQSDGMVERFNRTLKDMVAKYIDSQGLTWDREVKAYAMAYNSAVHDTTGYSPFYLIHGFEPRLPIDERFWTPLPLVEVDSFPEKRRREMRKAFEDVRRATGKAASDSARRYDESVQYTSYQNGDKVWVRDHTASVGGKPKLAMPYKGPATIIRKIGQPGKEVAYEVRLPGSRDRIVHHNDLKPLIQRESTRPNENGETEENKTVLNLDRSTLEPRFLTRGKGGGSDSGNGRPVRTTWVDPQAMPPCPPPPGHQRELPPTSPTGEATADYTEPNETNPNDPDQGNGGSGTPARDEPYDEALLTPYVSRYGRKSIPVQKYQAGVSPSVSEMKHKYEMFLKRTGGES